MLKVILFIAVHFEPTKNLKICSKCEVVSTFFFTSMSTLNKGAIMGVIEEKEVNMTSYTAGRISKIKFLVGSKFFSNDHKKICLYNAVLRLG